jgi:hypothetical protein
MFSPASRRVPLDAVAASVRQTAPAVASPTDCRTILLPQMDNGSRVMASRRAECQFSGIVPYHSRIIDQLAPKKGIRAPPHSRGPVLAVFEVPRASTMPSLDIMIGWARAETFRPANDDAPGHYRLYDNDRGCLPSRSLTLAGAWVAGTLHVYSGLRAGPMVMVTCSLIFFSQVGLEWRKDGRRRVRCSIALTQRRRLESLAQVWGR